MAEAKMKFYDFAKQVANSETPLDAITANAKYDEMADYINNNKFTMLLCRERYDYTVFSTVNKVKNLPKISIAKELREVIEARGQLLVADKQDSGEYEIWIRDRETKENSAYYLFNAENCVLEV